MKEIADLRAREAASKTEIEKLRCRVQELEDTLVALNVQTELRDEEFKREARLAIPYVTKAYKMTDDETLAECCSLLDAGDPQSVAGALDKVSASCKLVLQARQCCKACKVSRSSLTLQALARRSDSSSTQRAVLARLTQGRRSRERHDVGFGAPRATLPCNVDALGH